jgi:hypothetical protein
MKKAFSLQMPNQRRFIGNSSNLFLYSKCKGLSQKVTAPFFSTNCGQNTWDYWDRDLAKASILTAFSHFGLSQKENDDFLGSPLSDFCAPGGI